LLGIPDAEHLPAVRAINRPEARLRDSLTVLDSCIASIYCPFIESLHDFL
jgi:hypothetical protein